jgi:prevent-host-death family protein
MAALLTFSICPDRMLYNLYEVERESAVTTYTTLDSNEARSRWREVLDAGAKKLDVVITRYGKPVSVVIDYEDYAALQEELDELRAGQRAQAELDKWLKDPSIATPWDDFKAELAAKGVLDDEE